MQFLDDAINKTSRQHCRINAMYLSVPSPELKHETCQSNISAEFFHCFSLTLSRKRRSFQPNFCPVHGRMCQKLASYLGKEESKPSASLDAVPLMGSYRYAQLPQTCLYSTASLEVSLSATSLMFADCWVGCADCWSKLITYWP